MRAYFLTSARLGFSIWSPDDLRVAMDLWGDPNVTRLTGGPFTAAQVAERLLREIENLEQRGVQYWPVFLLDTGEHVGCCGLQPHDDANGIYELGFQLRQEYWGRGFGREAAQATISHSFKVLGVQTLYAGHHPFNEASRRLLQGLGFRYTHDEFYPPTGQNEPCYLLRSAELIS